MSTDQPSTDVPLGVVIFAGGIVLVACSSPLGPGLITLGIGVEIGRREV